jgi:hypothetical protein
MGTGKWDHCCARHADTPAIHNCAKYGRYLCEDCLCCQDPKLFCRWRTSCVIWEVSRHQRAGREEDGES